MEKESNLNHRILEYLYNFSGATRTDINIALGNVSSANLTKSLKSLLESKYIREQTINKRCFYVINTLGRRYFEKIYPYYEKNSQAFRHKGAKGISDSTATRESASLCLGLSQLQQQKNPGLKLCVYPSEKPSFGELMEMLSWYKMFGHSDTIMLPEQRKVQQAEELLKGGVYYSSVEFKRYLDSEGSSPYGSAGGEAVYSSRINGILIREKELYVFYRSAGPIPRFRQESEYALLRELLVGRLDQYLPFYYLSGMKKPVAIITSRSTALIPALATGYAHGRVKNPESLKDTPRAKKVRSYYESRFFNPCCGLFSACYCIPYAKSRLNNFSYIAGTKYSGIDEDTESWKDDFNPHWCTKTYYPGCLGSYYDPYSRTDVIFQPFPDLTRLKYIRNHMYDNPSVPFTVVTFPVYADSMARILGTRLKRVINVVNGEDYPFKPYDDCGFPLGRPDNYKEASRKWWDSSDCPHKLSELSVGLHPDAFSELKEAADRGGCSTGRFAAEILSAVMDSSVWARIYGSQRPEDFPGFRFLMAQQDRKNSKETGYSLKIRSAVNELLGEGGYVNE